jgi:hypothetical protein
MGAHTFLNLFQNLATLVVLLAVDVVFVDSKVCQWPQKCVVNILLLSVYFL